MTSHPDVELTWNDFHGKLWVYIYFSEFVRKSWDKVWRAQAERQYHENIKLSLIVHLVMALLLSEMTTKEQDDSSMNFNIYMLLITLVYKFS